MTVEQGSAGDRTYVAVWRESAHSVSARAALLADGSAVEGATVSVSCAGETADGSLACPHGEVATLSAPDLSPSGMRFAGWYADPGEGAAPSGEPLFAWRDWPVRADADASYVAAYAPAEGFVVTFYANAQGATGEMAPQVIEAGSAERLEALGFGLADHGFAGWDTEPGGTGERYANRQLVRPEADLDLYAVWEPGVYSISYDLDGGAEADPDSPNPTSYTADSPAFTPAPPTRAGHDFQGWTWANTTTHESSDDPDDGLVVGGGRTGDLALRASWAPKSYAVAAYSRTGTEASPVAHIAIDGVAVSSGTYDYGSKVTLEAKVDDASKWNFLGWYEVTETVTDDDGNAYAARYGADALGYGLKLEVTVRGDVSVVAVFDPVGKRKLTVDAINGAEYYVGDDHGTVQWGSSYTVDFGQKVTLTAKEPKRVMYWTNNASMVLGTGGSVTLTMTSDQVVHLAYAEDGDGQCFVRFLTDYDQVLRYYQISASTDYVDVPDGPSKVGREFDCWRFEDTGGKVTEASLLERAASAAGGTITARPSYKPVAAEDVKYGSVTLHRLDGSGSELDAVGFTSDAYPDGRVPVGDYVSVAADAEATVGGVPYEFSCWVSGTGADAVAQGYGERVNVKVRGAEHLYARYVPAGSEAGEKEPATWVSYLGAFYEGKYKVSCGVSRSVPEGEGYEVAEAGVLVCQAADRWNADTMVLSAVDNSTLLKYDSGSTTLTGVHTQTMGTKKPNLEFMFRGYLVVRKDGKVETYYTRIVSGSYNSLTAANSSEGAGA